MQYQKKKVRLVENIQEGEKEEKEEKENIAKHEKNVEENLEDDEICVYIGDGLKKIDLFFCCVDIDTHKNNGLQQTKHYSYRSAGVGEGTG